MASVEEHEGVVRRLRGPAIKGDSWAAVNTPSSSRTAEASAVVVPPNLLWLAR